MTRLEAALGFDNWDCCENGRLGEKESECGFLAISFGRPVAFGATFYDNKMTLLRRSMV
jgi:hypothetical protein